MLSEILGPVMREYGFQALIVGGQIAKAYHLFGEVLSERLMKSSDLAFITAATHIDTSALLGTARALIGRGAEGAEHEKTEA